MEKQVIVKPDVLEARVFGVNAPPSVWSCDLLSRLPLLHMSLDKSSIIRFEALRVMMLRNLAIEAARAGQHAAEESRPRSLPNSDKIIASLESLVCVKGIVDGRGFSHMGDTVFDEAIWMALDLTASDIESQIAEFEADFIAEASGCMPGEPERMRRSIDYLEGALRTDGVIHIEQLRITYAMFREHLRMNHGTGTPGMWLRMGWLQFILGDDPIDAERAIHEAARLSGRNKTITHWLACRFMAYMHSLNGQHDDAHRWAAQALQLRNDAITMLEASLYAASCNRIRECRTLMAHAFMDRPLLSLLPLANENYSAQAREVIASLHDVEPKLRGAAKGLLAQWQTTSKKVQEAGRTIGQGEIASIHLISGHGNGMQELGKADVFVSWFLAKTFETSKKLLIEQSKATIERELARTQALIQEAERSIENCVLYRDQELRRIQKERDEAVIAARQEVRKAMRYESTLDAGCGMSVGLTVAGFAIFAVVGAIGVWRGFAFGIETTLGRLALGLAVAPVIIAVLAQLAQTAARMRLEAATKDRVHDIDIEFRNKVGVADRECREKVADSRSLLEDRGREMRMCREALRTVTGSTKSSVAELKRAA